MNLIRAKFTFEQQNTRFRQQNSCFGQQNTCLGQQNTCFGQQNSCFKWQKRQKDMVKYATAKFELHLHFLKIV